MESHESSCQRSMATVKDCSVIDVFRASAFTRNWKIVANLGMVMGNETEMKDLLEVIRAMIIIKVKINRYFCIP